MFKKIILTLFLGILVLAGVLVFNTFRGGSQQANVPQVAPEAISDSVLGRLAGAVQIKTVSYDSTSMIDYAQFERFHAYLAAKFPLVSKHLQREIVGKYSLLYTWKGKDAALAPIVLTGHIDVVPVEESTEKEWKQPPFSGAVADSCVWGRGTVDDKGAVMAILEAAEHLLAQGFVPERTIYFAFGHDEELTGTGARALVDYFAQRKIRAEFVMDEGLVITSGMVPGVTKDVALVGIAEKGYLSLQLTAQLEGGHSSMPAKQTAIDALAQAITKLRSTPFEPQISQPVAEFMHKLGPEMSFVNRMAFANRWLLEPVIFSVYQGSPSGAAMVQTTMAPTVIRGGIKENAVPSQASVVFNFRVLPGTTLGQVMKRVEEIVDNPHIKVDPVGMNTEATPVSSTKALGFVAIERSVRELSPQVLVAPSLMIAYADARFYTAISDNVYRFYPVTFRDGELSMLHGLNEHISIANYKQSIRYYLQIIRNGSKKSL